MVRAIAVVMGLGVVVAVQGGPAEEAVRRDQERLAGTWRVVQAEIEGRPVPPAEYRGLRLTFADGKFTARRGEEEAQEGTYVLDALKNPRHINITRSNGPTGSRKQLGIYQFTGDTLRICTYDNGEDRPSSFDTRDRPGCSMLVLRREPK
jgi:uncharacterized protein (TIGR03067 family)